MGAVEMTGLYDLIYKLEKCKDLGRVKDKVKQNGVELQNKIARCATPRVIFNKGYSEGHTLGSVSGHTIDGGMGYEAGASMEYDPYVEHGTRKMAAEPFVKPAFQAQKELFIDDMKELVGD